MDMIERVTAAILRKEVEMREANNLLLAAAGLWPDHLYRAPVKDIAIAAIEALREPTEPMLRAMYGNANLSDPDVVALNDHINAQQYRAAINAAIAPKVATL